MWNFSLTKKHTLLVAMLYHRMYNAHFIVYKTLHSNHRQLGFLEEVGMNSWEHRRWMIWYHFGQPTLHREHRLNSLKCSSTCQRNCSRAEDPAVNIPFRNMKHNFKHRLVHMHILHITKKQRWCTLLVSQTVVIFQHVAGPHLLAICTSVKLNVIIKKRVAVLYIVINFGTRSYCIRNVRVHCMTLPLPPQHALHDMLGLGLESHIATI